jgi:Photosynthesis affected mutant 68
VPLLKGGSVRVQVVKGVDLPMGLVFVVQSMVAAAALAGITYGATSASWDPKFKGSALGWKEFRTNLAAIMGKMGRD